MHVNKVVPRQDHRPGRQGAEDGLIRVQGLDNESVMAFTDFGFDSLVALIKIHREMTPPEER